MLLNSLYILFQPTTPGGLHVSRNIIVGKEVVFKCNIYDKFSNGHIHIVSCQVILEPQVANKFGTISIFH